MWEDFINRAYTRHLELTRLQFEATLISMRNRAIQSNLPFVPPTDHVADLEFASGETQSNIISDSPFKTQPIDGLHSDPNEELYDEVMFADKGISIVSHPQFTSFFISSKPSSSRSDLDFGLSLSSFKPVVEEINTEDQTHQTHHRTETKSTPKHVNADAAHVGPSKEPAKLDDDKTSPTLPFRTQDHPLQITLILLPS